jgi:hypothetical protein
MKLSTTWTAVVCIVAGGAMAACGGDTVSGGSEPGTDGGTHHDAVSHVDSPAPGDDATQPWSPVCPVTAPAVGTVCTKEGITCEYGQMQYDVACDTVLQCGGGTWSKFDTFMTCTPDAPNAAACPSTLTAVPQGGSCAPNGLSCAYPEGVCSCAPQIGPVEFIDGGQGPTWTCNPGPGCPMPRPRLGSPCTGNTSCSYESCAYGQSCQDGAWLAEEEGCAEAG